MSKRNDWQDTLRKCGGRLVNGDTRYDGIIYSYRSVWNEDEDIDAFLDTFPHGTVKSDRDYVNKVLTLFFTVTPNG